VIRAYADLVSSKESRSIPAARIAGAHRGRARSLWAIAIAVLIGAGASAIAGSVVLAVAAGGVAVIVGILWLARRHVQLSEDNE
jgi:hypothetical protein